MTDQNKRRLHLPGARPTDAFDNLQRATRPQDAAKAEPRLEKRQRSIDVEWYDPDLGDWRSATVISRIMNADERTAAGRAVVTLTGNTPWELLPESLRVRATALCQVTIQIRDMPDWLKFAIFVDMDLLMLLHRQCVQHDMVYLHPDGAARAAHPQRARVSVTTNSVDAPASE